jgi:DNA-binding NarL/FixJ family response regulator
VVFLAGQWVNAPVGSWVLFVLRHPLLARKAGQTLERAGYLTKWAVNLDEALSQLSRDELESLAAVVIERDTPGEAEESARLASLRERSTFAGIVALTDTLAPGDITALLGCGILPIEKPVHSRVLAYALLGLVIKLQEPDANKSGSPPDTDAPPASSDWPTVLATYAKVRSLSPKQNLVLRLHLEGKNDKEIATLLQCSETTVYEHWRRMMKKAMVKYKREVLADFHGYTSNAIPLRSSAR